MLKEIETKENMLKMQEYETEIEILKIKQNRFRQRPDEEAYKSQFFE